MSAPTLKVYLGYGSTWQTEDADITWTDETSYVLQQSVAVNRGRSSELDDYRAGTASFTLNNSTRRFDPVYAAGDLFGDLLPGVPVKITATPAGQSEQQVFRGFVEGWPQDYALGNTLSVCQIAAVDGFGKLAAAGLPSSAYALEVEADSPAAWWRLTEKSGALLADSSGNRVDGEYDSNTTLLAGRHPNQWETVSAIEFDGEHKAVSLNPITIARPLTLELVALPDIPNLTRFDIFQIGDGSTVAAALSLVRVDASGGISVEAMLDDDSASAFLQSDYGDVETGAPVHIAARWPAVGNGSVYVNGVDVTDTRSTVAWIQVSGAVIAGPGVSTGVYTGPLGEVAWYESDIGASRISDHADAFISPRYGDATGARVLWIAGLVGWPSDLLDLATGLSTLGPAQLRGNALSVLKRIEAAEQGRLFISRTGSLTFLDRYHHQTVTEGSTAQATLSDDGSDIPYGGLGYDFDNRFVFNRVRVSRSGGAEIEVSDSTSIATHGEHLDSSLSGIDFLTDNLARSAGEYRLAKYKDPQHRVRPVEVKLHGLTAAQQTTILSLELGYRVNVERTPQGVGAAIDDDYLIEGISHRISGGAHEVTLTLSPADAVDHAVWGTSTWGDDSATTEAIWGY